MTLRTKNILVRSLYEYQHFSENQKENAITQIKNQLEKNNFAMKHIGIGLDQDKVKAGEIFLRIIK